jgi:hypothetical protein
MHRNTAEIVAHDLALPDVDASTHVDAELLNRVSYRLPAADGPRWTIKSR